MDITDGQREELQAFCDERHLDYTVGVRHFRGGGQEVVLCIPGDHPCLALKIGTSYLQAKRWLEERFGDLAGT